MHKILTFKTFSAGASGGHCLQSVSIHICEVTEIAQSKEITILCMFVRDCV